MDDFSIKIAKIIRQYGLTGRNYGLMDGNTGISILFYHLARNTNNPEFEKVADELLDVVFANLNTLFPVDFENGLAGIGWGIEYLVQNNFVEGNTDKILEEVDNKIFRTLIEESHNSIELGNGLTGILFYLINRLKMQKAPLMMANRINRELLILTINKIDELVITQIAAIVKEMQFDLFWRFPLLLFGCTEAFRLNIYNYKINNMIRQWLPYFEAFIPSLQINRLYLSVVLMHIHSLMPEKRLEKQSRILLYATDFELLRNEVDHNMINVRFGWPGFLALLSIAMKELPEDWQNYTLIRQTYRLILGQHYGQLEKLSENKPNEKTLTFGLSLGLAGISIIELFWPGILTGKESKDLSIGEIFSSAVR